MHVSGELRHGNSNLAACRDDDAPTVTALRSRTRATACLRSYGEKRERKAFWSTIVADLHANVERLGGGGGTQSFCGALRWVDSPRNVRGCLSLSFSPVVL